MGVRLQSKSVRETSVVRRDDTMLMKGTAEDNYNVTTNNSSEQQVQEAVLVMMLR